MAFPPLFLAFLVLSVFYAVYRQITRISLRDVPGPTSTSFLYGIYLAPFLRDFLTVFRCFS
ncbi:hypothetical protein ARMSODRAFT_962545 [Armillaria solidipes]|uniref:Uncharacterized protein n=1 Tax=Armillaria solidipes TaxID=1076256 RepID=A0A2H3AZE2_9AGAR|nr:hypothetical protein ARMSODRAFT_962545 [Armillaria solidipes]